MQSGATTRKMLFVYDVDIPSLVDVNLSVNQAVDIREAEELRSSQTINNARSAFERRRVSPKKAERINGVVYFTVSFNWFTYIYSLIVLGLFWKRKIIFIIGEL